MSASAWTNHISLESTLAGFDNFTYGKWQVAGAVAGIFATYKLAGLLKWWFIDPRFSPLRDVPGPDSFESMLLGDFQKIVASPPSSVYKEWFAQYGHSVTYRGVFLARQLCTKDPKAIAHILNNAYDFPKAPHMRAFLVRLFGEGMDHKRQRKILTPCFGPSHIRDLTPVFYDKAFELRDIWLHQIEESEQDVKEIDVFVWLARATLDIIGLAGFDYIFDTLNQGETDELVKAFMELFAPMQSPPTIGLLADIIPLVRHIPTERSRLIARSKDVMAKVGRKLVREKREAVLAAATGDGALGKKSVGGKDLLSVLIKANMATDLKDSKKMNDEEVIGQIYTLLIAGHETTSTTLTRLLYDLAHPENHRVQTKLREELQSVSTDRPSVDELNALPYLDAVLREALRLNSALDITLRCAGKDTSIPVSKPIGAGEEVIVPITLVNRDKEIWGEDAEELKPERWLNGDTLSKGSEIPGVYSSLLTFLGGPRSCIGYRFALLEMKALIFALLRNIAVELPDPPLAIERKSLWQVAGAATGGFLVYKLAGFLKWWFIDPQFSPLKDIPGPDSYESVLVGDFRRIVASPPSSVYKEWFTQYGHTVSYRGVFLTRSLCTKDPKAIAHILNNAYEFPKPPQLRGFLVWMFGEGDVHRRQRKILTPCFGPSYIRDLAPIFYDKAYELRDIWLHQIEETGRQDQEIDVFVWLARATLDIIGLAGFDYPFETLSKGEIDELVVAFMQLFAPMQSPPTIGFLMDFIPLLRVIPIERTTLVDRSKEVMARVGARLVRERRETVLASANSDGSVEQKSVIGKDLLSVLIKSNMATDIKDSERMNDEEVIGQISTLLIAGHETTSTTLTWLFYDLAHPQNHGVQKKLREELQSVSTDRPSVDELNALPYLDAVVREALRLNSALDITFRSAGQDTSIPVSKPYIDKRGVERTEIRIGAGEEIVIPIALINKDKEIWGEDAEELRPERWLEGDTHPKSSEIPGVFSSLLTFLGGPRSCIGHRFALLEMKALIFALLRNISVELPDPVVKIDRKSFIVTRPAIVSDDGKMESAMPLLLKPARME
ncbi:hypothetical protein FRB90_004113 [Tulasnella sp. 427]|nr:hypothetical protein FRB90_004113 [Tulasnella sp. 427]